MNLSAILGTDLPIIQAPMAGSQGSALAVAVCQAGGLGSLPAAMLSVDDLRVELSRIQVGTDRPFNVNFFCHEPSPVDEGRDAAWRSALTPYYQELAVDAASAVKGPGRAPFSAEALAAIAPFNPPVVSFHFGLPAPALMAGVKTWGAKVLASATTVDEARWLQAHGADIVIAQGLEAGGHRGHFLSHDLSLQMGTFALLPQVVRAVKVPVVAAGGIADAQGVAAALALGAAGVQVGTAYLTAHEATTSKVHRAVLRSERARHTALTNLFSGRPARGIVNRLMTALGPISDLPPEFPLATAAIAPLRAKAESLGSGDFSPLWSGQNASGCHEASAAEITRALAVAIG